MAEGVGSRRGSNHTVDALLDAALDELDEHGESGVGLERVASRAGSSIGAIYHHFRDRDGLLDAARLRRFRADLEDEVEMVRLALRPAHNLDEVKPALEALARLAASADRRRRRAARLSTIGAATTRSDLREAMAIIQNFCTQQVAHELDDLAERCSVVAVPDALTVAVQLQALLLGQVLADLTPLGVDPAAIRAAEVAAMMAMFAPSSSAVAIEVERPTPVLSEHAPERPTASTTRGRAAVRALLDAARRQILAGNEADFRLDLVLAEAGATTTTLYKYFGGREGLYEAAWIEWARENADADVEVLQRQVEAASDPETAVKHIVAAVLTAQNPGRAVRRQQRLAMFAAAAHRDALHAEVAALEADTNARYRAVLQSAVDRGLLQSEFDLETVAVFVRAFSFGRLTNEMSDRPVQQEDWERVVRAVTQFMLPPGDSQVGGQREGD